MAPGEAKVGERLTRRQAAKLRTQQRLLAAARQMTAAGEEVSVAKAAQRAGISTATAYRYYSDVPTLLSDAALDLRMDEGQDDFIVEFEKRTIGVTDPLERLLIAQKQMAGFTAENETDYRLFMAKAQEQYVRDAAKGRPVARGGRRLMMIEAALKSLKPQMSSSAYRDLVVAVMMLTGPEPYFVLTDYAGLKGEALHAVNAQALRDLYNAHMARARL